MSAETICVTWAPAIVALTTSSAVCTPSVTASDARTRPERIAIQLIELHINFKSFEMNAFLKLLAIVSFLGLIPSVAGGLLGMNVAGNPWPVTLGQVAFGVAMGMATALYVFAVRGWLK
jgi:Mg2+ and Co2+ transporter CorA